jgi:hypothetical protein
MIAMTTRSSISVNARRRTLAWKVRMTGSPLRRDDCPDAPPKWADEKELLIQHTT